MSERKKTIVLVGGCFDILHPGHIIFLERAKKAGDKLVILLENDQKVKMLKGPNRPIQTQKDRARVLSALRVVDQVVCLPFIKEDFEYDLIISKIKPDVIAVSRGYKNVKYHQRVAKLLGAKLKYVTEVIGDYSTSGILNRNGVLKDKNRV